MTRESRPSYGPVGGPVATALRKAMGECEDAPCCYMCMEATAGAEGAPTELIAPCPCQTYVHRDCLEHWRVSSNTHHAMTHCPNCKHAYVSDVLPEASTLQHEIFKAQVWRAVAVLAVVLAGSMVIFLVDAGTPKFFHLHWNALDGKIYHWVGLTGLPRFVVYSLLSLAMMAFVTTCIGVVRWCRQESAQPTLDFCIDWNCHNSDLNGCDQDFAWVVLVIVVVCAIFVGLVMLVMAIVGSMGSAVDRREDHHIRTLQVQQTRIRNLRPLSQV